MKKTNATNSRHSSFKYYQIDGDKNHNFASIAGRCKQCKKVTDIYCDDCNNYICEKHMKTTETNGFCHNCAPETARDLTKQEIRKIRKQNEIFRLVESATAITMITSEEFLQEIKKIFKNVIIKESKGLVEVTLKTSKEIENIPGVISLLYSWFAEHGINIIETMSCWTDTIFIIEEKDLAKVMEVLRF